MVEVRANDINLEVKSRHIVAYGAVFNSRSVDLGGFTEILLPSAITEETINQSDVLCLLDHSKARGVLARSNKGKGSLNLSVDERGLRYEFDAPHTQLGDELLENIQRGEITASSFSFIVGEDYFERNADGSITRYISKINRLTDVSPCYHPAYESTSVVCRSYEEFLKNNTEENPTEIVEEDKVIIEEPRSEETPIVEEEQRAEGEEKEEKTPENTEEKEQEKEEEKNEEEKPSEDEEKEEEGRNIDNKTNPNNIVKMEKFSLLKTLRDISENRGLNETAQAVVAEGRSQMQKAGLSASGQITLPTEYRSDNTNGQTNGVFASVQTKGQENVSTDLIGLVEPLRNAMVNNGAGVNFLSGLVGDVELAYYDGSNCGWAGETEAAANGEGSWSKIKLQPKRLTSFIDISKQFLVQDGTNAEEMLMRDIQNALRQKLESTIYSDNAAGNPNIPEGMFSNCTQDATSLTYADIVDMQKELMSKNINGNYKIVCSPSAYAQLRLIKLDSGSGRFYLEGNTTVDGIPVIVSNSVMDNGLILGDFNELMVAQWGGIDLVVDNVSRAIYGQVRVVINSYWDVQPRRKEAFVCRLLKG